MAYNGRFEKLEKNKGPPAVEIFAVYNPKILRDPAAGIRCNFERLYNPKGEIFNGHSNDSREEIMEYVCAWYISPGPAHNIYPVFCTYSWHRTQENVHSTAAVIL